MSCLAVIPARGHSKGVPRKNVRPIAGMPLIARTVVAAVRASLVTRVVVSTDDPEIAAVAARHGAEVITRPPELSGDTASSESALLHCLETLRERESYEPELVTMLQCTSPLTRSEDIDGAIRALSEKGADSCFTAVPFHHFLWRRDEALNAAPINHSGHKRKRRQDMEPQYLENGAVYVMRTRAFIEAADRFCGRVVCHAVDESQRHEIDSLTDFAVAEVLLRDHERRLSRELLPSPVEALVLDFDGVLTDNRVLVTDDGHEAVFCSRGDGMGLSHLAKAGVKLLILSKEKNAVVARRAEKLGIECMHAIDDKPAALSAWLQKNGVAVERTVFVGNDVNDVACMTMVGCSACPADAHPSAVAAARITLEARGGHGAVRELCDMILENAAS